MGLNHKALPPTGEAFALVPEHTHLGLAQISEIQNQYYKAEGFINRRLIKSYNTFPGVILNMKTAAEFKAAKLQLESIFGNNYLVYDQANHLTSYSFTGLVDQKIYKDYIRRIVTTTSEVPYLISGYAIAISGYPMLRQEVIAAEPHTLQNEVAYWTIYTKRENDPILLTVQSL